jgi:integrase
VDVAFKPVRGQTPCRWIGALRWAQGEKWITRVPKVEVPRQPPPRDRWLSREEAERLLEGARELHIRTFLAICLFTAARAGAVLELTWDRVDLAAGLIDLGQAPGGKGRSVVPIAERLRPVLAEAREGATCRYVIERGGHPVASVRTGTRAASRRAGLENITPHILRHTAASWMAMGGVPIDEIAKALGHANPAITWRVYAKHSPDYLRRAFSVLSG